MAVRMSLDEKIEKAEAVVAAAKKKYDDALDELEKLVAKRKELDDKKVLEAYHSGQKTADEIIAFIKSEDGEEKPRLILWGKTVRPRKTIRSFSGTR